MDLGWGSSCGRDRNSCPVKIRWARTEVATPITRATHPIRQPKSHCQFGDQENHRHIKEAAQAEPVQHGAAGEVGHRAGPGPDRIVNADHLLKTGARLALAHQGLKGGPGKAHAGDHGHHDQDLARRRLQLRAHRQRAGHDAKPDLQRGKVSEPLRESPASPGEQRVRAPIQRRQAEVRLVVKAEHLLHVEVEIVEIIDRGGGVQPLQNEITGLKMLRTHGRHYFPRVAFRASESGAAFAERKATVILAPIVISFLSPERVEHGQGDDDRPLDVRDPAVVVGHVLNEASTSDRHDNPPKRVNVQGSHYRGKRPPCPW